MVIPLLHEKVIIKWLNKLAEKMKNSFKYVKKNCDS